MKQINSHLLFREGHLTKENRLKISFLFLEK